MIDNEGKGNLRKASNEDDEPRSPCQIDMNCIFMRFLLEWDNMCATIVGFTRRCAIYVLDIRILLVRIHRGNLRSRYAKDVAL